MSNTLSQIQNPTNEVSKYQQDLFSDTGREHLNIPDASKNNELHTFWMSGVKDDKILGEGAFGSTILSCDKNYFCYAIKKQSIKTPLYRSYFDTELRCLIENRALEFIPRVFSAWIKDGDGYIVMEELEKINYNQLLGEGDLKEGQEHEVQNQNLKEKTDRFINKLNNYLEILAENKWLHTDTHSENIMMRKNPGSSDGQIVLIDFGLSVCEDQVYFDGFYRRTKNFDSWENMKLMQSINVLIHFVLILNKRELYNKYYKDKMNNLEKIVNQNINNEAKEILRKIENIENISETNIELLKYIAINQNFDEIKINTLFKNAEKNVVKNALFKKLAEYRSRETESNDKNNIKVFIDNLINPNKQKEKDAISNPESTIPKSVSSRYKNLIMYIVGNNTDMRETILDILPLFVKEEYLRKY